MTLLHAAQPLVLKPVSGGAPSRVFARQPILTAEKQVIAYELLFHFPGETAETNFESAMLSGIESLGSPVKSFLRCSREMILDRGVTLLPAGATVLELRSDVAADEEVLDACLLLRRLGYQISFEAENAEFSPVLDLADYVKVHAHLVPPGVRREIAQIAAGRGVLPIAGSVESEEEFHILAGEGFHYFQGYFFCRPAITPHTSIPASRANYVRLMAALGHEPFSWGSVEKIIEDEPSLCYRLMRLVNSGAYYTQREVTSIESALVIVGEQRFRNLAMMAVAAESGKRQPPELLVMAMQRARFCEMAAGFIEQHPGEQYLYGLLSLLHAILRMPMEDLADLMPVRRRVKAALLGEVNEVTSALDCLRLYEAGRWQACADRGEPYRLTLDQVSRLYMASLASAQAALHTNEA